ncbi:hypothetical protein LY78DRAFT_160778 [Colletotrichum sublineola]|nr:hypothetical protein LY78DRAFT_160778 [Colletotrichum sublineola]
MLSSAHHHHKEFSQYRYAGLTMSCSNDRLKCTLCLGICLRQPDSLNHTSITHRLAFRAFTIAPSGDRVGKFTIRGRKDSVKYPFAILLVLTTW